MRGRELETDSRWIFPNWGPYGQRGACLWVPPQRCGARVGGCLPGDGRCLPGGCDGGPRYFSNNKTGSLTFQSKCAFNLMDNITLLVSVILGFTTIHTIGLYAPIGIGDKRTTYRWHWLHLAQKSKGWDYRSRCHFQKFVKNGRLPIVSHNAIAILKVAISHLFQKSRVDTYFFFFWRRPSPTTFHTKTCLPKLHFFWLSEKLRSPLP